jgi:hypothetical protein
MPPARTVPVGMEGMRSVTSKDNAHDTPVSYGRGVTAVFSVTIFLAATVVAAFLVRRSRRVRRWRHAQPWQQASHTWPASLEHFRPGALKQARRQLTEATERADEAARLRRCAEASVQQHIAATATLTAELEATSSRIAALEACIAELRATFTGVAGWDLLLARVERQWADVVNAGADERGVIDAPHRDQLTEAVRRDLERLREEIGVNATLAASPPVDGDPLTTLLAVGEAAALLAYHSEHVIVDLGDPAVVSGHDWTGDDNARRRLDRLAATATAAGLNATVKVLDNTAQVMLDLRSIAEPPVPPS